MTRWRAAVVGLVLGMGLVGPSVAAPPWPGLPDDFTTVGGGGTRSSGVSEVARARQWARIPDQTAAFWLKSGDVPFPAGDPQGRINAYHQDAKVYLSSPVDGEHGYGEGLPFTVRTVAFGSVPVQARVQILQLRATDGSPEPLQAHFLDWDYDFAHQHEVRPGVFQRRYTVGAEVTGRVALRVLDLTVDGIDLGLTAGCAVVRPVELSLASKRGFWWGDPELYPVWPLVEGNYDHHEYAQRFASLGVASPSMGGMVAGEIDVPAFAGCRTATGEDVSRLLTASVSGPGNEVQVALSPLTGADLKTATCPSLLPPVFIIPGARAPFSGDPSDCPAQTEPAVLPFPSRPAP